MVDPSRRYVGLSVFHKKKGGKLHSHASIGAIAYLILCEYIPVDRLAARYRVGFLIKDMWLMYNTQCLKIQGAWKILPD